MSQKNTWKNFCFFCVRGEGKRIDLDRTNTPEVVAKGSLDRITAALREEKLRGAATEAKLEAASPSTATSEEKKKKTPQKKNSSPFSLTWLGDSGSLSPSGVTSTPWKR